MLNKILLFLFFCASASSYTYYYYNGKLYPNTKVSLFVKEPPPDFDPFSVENETGKLLNF